MKIKIKAFNFNFYFLNDESSELIKFSKIWRFLSHALMTVKVSLFIKRKWSATENQHEKE